MNFLNIAKMQIVEPRSATAVEHSAALELQDHLKKMCGAECPIVKEGQQNAAKAVYVGATEYANACQITYPDNRFGEGWAIKAVDGNLLLCGGKIRGVLYAVYHLLENVFGVRWWTVWEESIPQMAEALVPEDYEASGVPSFEYRDVFAWPVHTDSRFAVRNRLNGWGFPIPMSLGGAECFGHPAHVHTFDRYFPENGSNPGDVPSDWAAALNPEKENYLETHPEWYAMTPRGVRVPKIICMSDEGLQKAFLEKLIKSIQFSYAEADAAGKTRPRLFDLSPGDMAGECHCPRCEASIREHGSSGHQIRFVNKMAAEVKKVYPEVILETIAYWHYLEPPKDDTKLSPDVALRYANSRMDLLQDIHHPNNKQYLEGLTDWIGRCGDGKLYIWDYGVYYNANGIVPSMYKMGDNFRTFAELGVNGYFLEMEQCITTDMWDMKVWMSAKLAEDHTLDQDQLMDTFLSGYYGPAAPYLRSYLDLAHKCVLEKPIYMGFGSTSVVNAESFRAEHILFFDRCFEDAFAAVGEDPVLLRRLRHARMGLDRVIIENLDKWTKQAADAGLDISFDETTIGRRICQTLQEQIALRGQWDPFGADVLKIYEKYLPGYVEPTLETVELSEYDRMCKHHGCCDGWKGISPIVVDAAELDSVPKDKLYVFPAEVDFAAAIADAPDAVVGSAARYDIGEKRRTGMISEQVMFEKNAVADNDDEKCIPVGVYTGQLAENGSPISAVWGTIRASDIIADGKYHLYKFPDIVAIAKDHGGTFHMFRDWSLLIYTMSWELGFLEGKKVDGYISMKVTGDVTCTDPDNLPVYYVDQIIVADKD